MSKTVRGVRTPIAGGSVVGRASGRGAGAAEQISIAAIGQRLQSMGMIPPPSSPSALLRMATDGSNATAAALQALATAAGTATLITKGLIGSTYDGNGVIPASETAGYAITSNYNGNGEVVFWNLVNSTSSSTQGFVWSQKLTSGTSRGIAELYGDDTTEVEFDIMGPTTIAYLGSDTTECYAGSFGALPFNIYTNNIVAATFDTSQNLSIVGTVTSPRLISTITTGTAPLTVASTTRVSNLNVATAGNADTVTTNANLTGPVTSTGNATAIGSAVITNTMLAGSIANSKLSNSSVTIGSTAVALGATVTSFTGLVNLTVSGDVACNGRLVLSTGESHSAWTTTGLLIASTGGTYTDTSSSGTVANVFMSHFAQPTIAASSTTTYTNAAVVHIGNAPVAGTNVTITNAWGLIVGGAVQFQSTLTLPGAATPIFSTSSAITTGAGSSAGTLTNAPAVGNPTKWFPINDNGTTRYVPAW